MTGCSLLLNTGQALLLNTGNELELNVVCTPTVTFAHGGSRKIRPKRQIQIVRIEIPLRITSKLNVPVEIRSVIKGRLKTEKIAYLSIKSALKTTLKESILLKSSLNAKIINEFSVMGQQSYKKLYEYVKLLTEMED